MRFKRKHPDSEELLRAVTLADQLLEKLIALLKTILQLMQRLDMEDSPARREYEEALHTLERLQQVKVPLAPRAEEEPAPEPAAEEPATEEAAPSRETAEAPAPDKGAPRETTLSRRVQLLFDRTASAESAEESAPVFSLFGSRRRHPAAGEAPLVLRRPVSPAADAARPQSSAGTPAKAPAEAPKTSAPSPVKMPAKAPAKVPSTPLAAPEAPTPLLSRTDTAAPPVPPMYKVQFSAVVPGPLLRGGDGVLHLFMAEKDFPLAAEDLLRQVSSAPRQAQRGVVVRVALQSPDLELTRSTQALAWPGEYLRFDFPLSLPEEFLKRQVLFNAVVYINEVIATRLRFLVPCAAPGPQIIPPRRRDVLSAFLSYAGEDRARAEALLQGMQKARPDLHVFSDVESLRSGEDWREVLPLEIARRDVFFLCWSHYAKESFWVNWEWNCALKAKGASCIEPIPLENPDRCPPPRDLDGKHFNDHLLYLMNAMQNGT